MSRSCVFRTPFSGFQLRRLVGCTDASLAACRVSIRAWKSRTSSVRTRIGAPKNNEKVRQGKQINNKLLPAIFERVNHSCQEEALALHSGCSADTRDPARWLASAGFGAKVTNRLFFTHCENNAMGATRLREHIPPNKNTPQLYSKLWANIWQAVVLGSCAPTTPRTWSLSADFQLCF